MNKTKNTQSHLKLAKCKNKTNPKHQYLTKPRQNRRLSSSIRPLKLQLSCKPFKKYFEFNLSLRGFDMLSFWKYAFYMHLAVCLVKER
jgi:hypothetical protein